VDARYRGAFFRLLMKTLAAPAAVDEFSGARLQAREAVGLDGAGLAQPSRQRLSPLTTRRSMARAEAAGRSSGEDRRDSRGLVCQLVCRARTRRNDVSRFVKESGEPDFHQLEPDVELAKPVRGTQTSRIVNGAGIYEPLRADWTPLFRAGEAIVEQCEITQPAGGMAQPGSPLRERRIALTRTCRARGCHVAHEPIPEAVIERVQAVDRLQSEAYRQRRFHSVERIRDEICRILSHSVMRTNRELPRPRIWTSFQRRSKRLRRTVQSLAHLRLIARWG
jgi:hypothetical protein